MNIYLHIVIIYVFSESLVILTSACTITDILILVSLLNKAADGDKLHFTDAFLEFNSNQYRSKPDSEILFICHCIVIIAVSTNQLD